MYNFHQDGAFVTVGILMTSSPWVAWIYFNAVLHTLWVFTLLLCQLYQVWVPDFQSVIACSAFGDWWLWYSHENESKTRSVILQQKCLGTGNVESVAKHSLCLSLFGFRKLFSNLSWIVFRWCGSEWQQMSVSMWQDTSIFKAPPPERRSTLSSEYISIFKHSS